MKIVFLALALSLGAASAAAQIYKCVRADGKAAFSDQPCPSSQRSEALVPAPGRKARPAARGVYGLTFALRKDAADAPALVHLACHGEPAELDHPHRNSCNPYQGDTSCRAKRPIACFKPTGADPPADLEQRFDKGWTRGQLGATQPIPGSELDSEQAASMLCEAELGAGWRMAEFHDGRGGWGFAGERGAGIRSGTRYWVRVNDQHGNCWDSDAPSTPPAPRPAPSPPPAPGASPREAPTPGPRLPPARSPSPTT